MRPIRAFLFARGANEQWHCQVFRDFEPLLEAAIAANGGRRYPVAVHVGFERPDTKAVEDLLSTQEGLVFLSNGAMGTMPFPVRASPKSIGSAGESSFHAALDGFGYQVEQPDEKPPLPVQPMSQIPSPENTGPRGWIATLSKLESGLAQKLHASGIWDEDSYLLNEAKLDVETRHVSGLLRYEILEGEKPNANSLIDRLRSAPPWLLSAPIVQLNLTVRSSNVCAKHGIKIIEDFTKYGLRGLYKLPNLGQRSIHGISQEMVLLLTTGRPLKAVASKLELTIPERLRNIPSDSNEDSKDLDADAGNHHGFCADLSESISSGFIEVTQKLSQKEQGVWASRLGFRCEPMTLQQIADQIGVTRERVRQIEVKLYRKVYSHPFWDELSHRVMEHLRGRTSPLFLSGLSAIDPWFKGADQLVHPLQEVSDHIRHLRFHILTWNDLPVISAISQAQLNESIEKAKSILMAIAEQNLREKDALKQASDVLIGKGEDMREALLEEVSKSCIWSALPDGTRIFTGFGNSANALVSNLLRTSDTPLHIDQIQQRLSAYSAYKEASARYIQKAASEVGILYGRGTYGLMKHCPLNPSQMLAICAEVEDIIFGGSSSKQWHSNELYEKLLNRGFDYGGKLTKYIINIALSNSTNLVYLRRMIWGVRGEWNENADARIDVKQAIVSLLEEEGKPMSTAQIRSRLIEGRGLNTYFQIWASSPLVRLGPGLWGLEGRDLDMQHARMIAYRLLKELSVRQEGMHVAEVAAFLGLGSEAEVSMLTSVANTDGLRMDKGQYCYLQPWGESRRISLWEAATSTLKAHPNGLPRGDLQLFVERISKRKVDRQQLNGVLQNIDAIYDAESSLWKFKGSSEDESEIDEESSNSSYES
jgi:hypothetical protein